MIICSVLFLNHHVVVVDDYLFCVVFKSPVNYSSIVLQLVCSFSRFYLLVSLILEQHTRFVLFVFASLRCV